MDKRLALENPLVRRPVNLRGIPMLIINPLTHD